MTREATKFIEEWFKQQPYEWSNKHYIQDVFLQLAERTEADTERQFRRLIPRAIYLSVNREVNVDYQIAEYIGELVENCSDNKRVRQEVQDLFFNLMAEDEPREIDQAFREAVRKYNIKHGFQCKR
jgi:hypothetical protein